MTPPKARDREDPRDDPHRDGPARLRAQLPALRLAEELGRLLGRHLAEAATGRRGPGELPRAASGLPTSPTGSSLVPPEPPR